MQWTQAPRKFSATPHTDYSLLQIWYRRVTTGWLGAGVVVFKK